MPTTAQATVDAPSIDASREREASPPGEEHVKQKHRYYWNHIGDLKRRLGAAMPREELRALHRPRAWRHFLVVFRHLGMVLLAGWALWQNEHKWLWPIAAVVQGFNILGFLILVHESIHQTIFEKRHPKIERILGLLYAFPAGISISQFERWHLDHHDELGHEEDDPKRAHLSPKKNSRWLKLLYATPALFVIYARASRDEAETYPQDVQKKIRFERILNLVLHLALAGTIYAFGGAWVLLRVWVIPIFFMFPPAFVLNRLGQHYDIDPTDPAKWTTLVNGNRLWHFLFLWSNFHIEHHYYQRVPFYNLPKLNRKLQRFYDETGLQSRTYREMVWGWLVENKTAHTDWHA